MANVGVMFKDGTFRIPSFERTLAGTTVIQCMKHIENTLLPNGTIKEFTRDDFTIEKVKSSATEVMLFGGKKVVPILKIDDTEISAVPGEITLSFQEYLQQIVKGARDQIDLTPVHISKDIKDLTHTEMAVDNPEICQHS